MADFYTHIFVNEIIKKKTEIDANIVFILFINRNYGFHGIRFLLKYFFLHACGTKTYN